MILIGIDDTDTTDSPGTNQLARRLADLLPPDSTLFAILRHQLLLDARIPFTSHNGAASLLVHAGPDLEAGALAERLRAAILDGCPAGSDPGLCIARTPIAPAIAAFGRRCQQEVATREEALALASRHGVHLEGLAGTRDGVVGALAAVGLAASGEDGRVVHRDGWPWPDPFAGPQPIAAIRARGVDQVLEPTTGAPVHDGVVDIGKHLRPAYRGGRVVLMVEALPAGAETGGPAWRALKLP